MEVYIFLSFDRRAHKVQICHLTGIQAVAGLILGSGTIFHRDLVMSEIISTAILSLPLIQVGKLSVTGESMGT